MRSNNNILLALFATAATVAAQSGVLTDGNSQLPKCGQTCPLLVQAAQACSATDVASQGAWVCFCQSAYLVNLRSSATGICDSTCSGADLQQVSTWYTTNCGSDNGASEHAGSGTATTTTAAGGAAVATTANDGSTAAATTASSGGSTSYGQNSLNGVGIGADKPETWWENHYQWIIMLIVLAIAFPLIAWGAVWLKKRHDRKQDQITTGFNAGITSRGPDMEKSTTSLSTTAGPSGSGRNSPQRTRSAYMPFGYNYTRSESPNRPVHPLARGETPVEMVERQSPSNKGKKVLVRERSVGEGSNDGNRWV